MKRLLTLILCSVLWLNIAEAKPTKITPSNISKFQVLGERFTCLSKSKLGLLDRTPIKAGRIWAAADLKTLNKKISDLKKQLSKEQKARRKNQSLIKQLQKEISQVNKLLPKSYYYSTLCPLASNVVDFQGDSESLAPYKETLSDSEIRHLLNKVAFGGNQALFTIGKTKGLTALVDELLTTQTSSKTKSDAMFWAGRQLGTDDDTGEKLWHTLPLQFLALYEALFSENPFPIRMALLTWHPHYAINLSKTGFGFNRAEHLAIKEYWERLEKNALGNFKTFTEEMISDPSMMRWLNNEDNAVGAPNQNFAREFLELFTMGPKDPITGALNYSEDSVVAATAYLSGYTQDYDSGTRRIVFNSYLKDPAPYKVFAGIPGAEKNQTFSAAAFTNHVLYNHPGSSRFISERLFAELVYPDVENGVVSSLAQQLVSSKYEIKPVLKTMLRSQAMFSTKARKRCVSNPIDQVIHLARKLLKNPPLQQTGEQIDNGDWLMWLMTDLGRRTGQTIFEPPSVFAWKGACGLNRDGKRHYGEGFITEQNVLGRSQLALDLVNYTLAQKVDFRTFIPSSTAAPRELITFIAADFFDVVPSEAAISILENFLTTEVTDEGTQAVQFNLGDKNYVNRKIPPLIVLLGELTEANQV